MMHGQKNFKFREVEICSKILIMTTLVVATLFDDNSVHHIHFNN